MKLIIIDLTEEKKIIYDKLIENLENVNLNFYKTYNYNNFLEAYFIGMEAIATSMAFQDKNFKKTIGFEKSLDGFLKLRKNLEKTSKSFRIFILEKIYTDLYQAFEIYMFDILLSLYSNIPHSLASKKILSESELIDAVQKKVTNLLYKNNIKKNIYKFKTIFKLNLKINNIQLNTLYMISQNRNVILHKNGVIDVQYISNLAKERIKSKYNLGNSLSQNIESELTTSVFLLKNLVDEWNVVFREEFMKLLKSF